MTETSIDVNYKELEISNGYFADIIVNDILILEFKAIENILPIHKAQLLSYLKLADLGLLLNFHGFNANFSVKPPLVKEFNQCVQL